jgi:hypothetical protein
MGLFSLVTNMPLSSGFMFSMIGSIISMASSASIAPSSRTWVIRLSTLPGWMLILWSAIAKSKFKIVAYIPKMTSGTSPAKDLTT